MRKSLNRIAALFVIVCLFVPCVAAQAAQLQTKSAQDGNAAQIEEIRDLDAFVTRTMTAFEVPGIAVAVVKDGKVVVAKGYGVRKLGDPARVDEHTMFGIASNTKAFTAAALAILVDDGKIKWDDPVTKYLPAFAVYDPYVTHELTIRDLVSHRSGLGLGAGDLMFWPDTQFTREEVLAHTRFIKPASSLRSKYAYNNLMFIVAGEVVHAVSGKPWEEFVRERIFTPLGMNATVIGSAGFRSGDDVAYPHSRGWRLQGALTPIAMTKDQTWAPAAGIKTNVDDLSKWVIVQLNHGRINAATRLFSEGQSREMWSAQTIVPIKEPPAPLKAAMPNFSAYGLGWSLRDYHGYKLVGHGGALTGMLSMVTMLPDQKLGIIVLTNQEEGGAMSAITNHILDSYLQLPSTDWISAYVAVRSEKLQKAEEGERKQAVNRVSNSHPSLDLAAYSGDYDDAWYGRATVRFEKGGLVLSMTRTPAMVADLQHWQYDTFKAVFRDKTIPDAFVTFTLEADGSVASMRMVPTSELADFSFDYEDLAFRRVRSSSVGQ